MAKVEQLIARLSAEGEVESRGEFTLDREKAKVKMRQFQLADPHRYVLVLVQAAVIKGATRIDFEIDADDMRMSFDGAPFTAADLDELYTSLFGGKRDRTIRARQELAVALNAAMGLNPRYIVLDSGDGESGVRLELRPDRPDVVETAEKIEAGTRIHVKDQFRPGLLVRFLRDLRGEIIEERHLRRSCAWATVEIHLDGQLISQQPPLAGAAGRVELRGADANGVAGFSQDEDWRARVQVLNNGVWLAEHVLPRFPLGFRAVVDGTALEKDVSQTDVVRNAEYDRLRFALRHACEESIVQACAHYLQSGEVWLAGVLRGALFREASRVEAELGKRAFVDALTDLPLWRDAGHGWVSTRQLLEASSPGFSTKNLPPLALPEGTCVVFALRDDEQQFFSRLADGKVSDRTRYLERMHGNERNRLAWRQRRQPARLGTGQYHGRIPLEAYGVRGELGIVQAGLEKASIRLVLDGCLLCELNPKFPLAGVVAVFEGPLTARADYQSANRDDALASCVRLFSEGLLQVMTQFASAWGTGPLTDDLRRLALAYLIVLTTRGRRTWLFRQFGFADKGAKRRAADCGDWADTPDWGIAEGDPHPLTRLRLFDTADGRVLSLHDLATAIAEDGELAWIGRDQPPIETPKRLVVRVTPRQRGLLGAVLGEAHLVDCEEEYALWVEHERFLLRPRAPLALDQWVHDAIEFEVDGLRGVLGLASFSLSANDGALVVPETGVSVDMVRAKLLLDERHLCDHWFTVGVPGLVATITGDLVVANENYSDLEGDTWVAVGQALGPAVAQLMGRLAELFATRVLADSLRHALMLTLRAIFGSPRMVHAYSRLREHAPDDAIREYRGLQELCIRYSSEEVGRAVRHLLRKGELPVVEAVEQRLQAQGREPGTWFEPQAHHRVHLASIIEAVSGVPLFPLAGGGDVGFSTLLELRAQGRLRYVDRRLAAQVGYDGGERILVVDEVLKIVIEALFGPRGIEDASAWLEAWDSERQLAGRQQLEQLRVPPASMLAVIRLEGELQGEIGLPRARPMPNSRSFVQLCRDRRPVCTVDLSHAIPIAAVLDWSELEVLQGDNGLLTTTGECAGWIASRIDERLDDLMDALASKQLSVTEAEQARIYVLMFLAQRLPRRAKDRDALLHGPLARLAALPVFEGVDGQLRTLVEIEHAYADRGKLSYLTTTPYERPRDRVVVRARHDELDAWRVLFPEFVDYAVESERERKLRHRKSMLHRLPEQPPRDALGSRRVDEEGLEGFLWLEGRQGPEAEVSFGAQGLTVGSLILDPAFCCRGTIQGPGVKISADWNDFEIDQDALHHLRRCALELYEQLADDGPIGDAGAAAGGAGSRQGPVRWILRAMAATGGGPVAVLREALLRLHAGIAWAPLDKRERALYRRLCELPLFPLSTGRAISLTTAVRERPTELAHYDLWGEVPPESAQDLVADLVEHQRPPEELVSPFVAPPIPPPPPPPARPEELLLDAIRAELRVVRTANQNILNDAHLDLIELREGGKRVVEIRGERVVVNVRHPVFVSALEGGEADPVRISFLASVVYTGLNVLLAEISDQHEQVFHRVHAAHVLSAVLGVVEVVGDK